MGAGGGRAARRGVAALRLRPGIGADGKAGKRQRGRSAPGNDVGGAHAAAGIERHPACLCDDPAGLGHHAAFERDPARVEHDACGHRRAGADEERSRLARDGAARGIAWQQALDGGDRRRRAGGAAAGALRRLGADALACGRAALDEVAELLARGGRLQGLGHLGGVPRLGQARSLRTPPIGASRRPQTGKKPSKIRCRAPLPGPRQLAVPALRPTRAQRFSAH